MSISTEESVRCPRCSASLRAGSEWCSLCYADLRPPPAEPPAPVEVPHGTATDVTGPAAEGDESGTGVPRSTDAPAAGGKHARSAAGHPVAAATPDEVARLADEMLAELTVTEGGNPLGAVSGLVDTTGKKALLMVGGATAAMLLCFLVMAVLGALV